MDSVGAHLVRAERVFITTALGRCLINHACGAPRRRHTLHVGRLCTLVAGLGQMCGSRPKTLELCGSVVLLRQSTTSALVAGCICPEPAAERGRRLASVELRFKLRHILAAFERAHRALLLVLLREAQEEVSRELATYTADTA